MKRIHVVASIAALLLLAGCYSTEEYSRVVEERDSAVHENEFAAERNKTLESQLKQNEQLMEALQKAKDVVDKEKGSLLGKTKDMTDQLTAAKTEASKVKQDLAAAQNEGKESAGKVKLFETQVGELKAQLAKATGDSDKARAELDATIDKLTVELNDAKAQIEKLEEAATEVKGETKPEEKAEPEKVIEPKSIDINKAAPPTQPKNTKVKDTKGSKVEKP